MPTRINDRINYYGMMMVVKLNLFHSAPNISVIPEFAKFLLHARMLMVLANQEIDKKRAAQKGGNNTHRYFRRGDEHAGDGIAEG